MTIQNNNTYSINQYNFDSFINKTENVLSYASAVPGAGFVPGGLKIVIGLVQTVAGGILTVAFKAVGHKGYQNYANIHFKHGLTNVLAGFFEAIPLVGLVLLFVRSVKERPLISYPEDAGAQIRSAHGFKFRAYPSLEERDVFFDNCSKEDSENLQQMYQQLRKNHPNAKGARLASQVISAQNLGPEIYQRPVEPGIKG